MVFPFLPFDLAAIGRKEAVSMQLIFRFSIDPAKYGKRFGLDIPDDSMDDIAIGGGSLPEGETGDDEDEPTATDEAIAEDAEYSSNAPSRQCQTTIENCRAQNPLTCPYHGLKVLKQDIEGFLRQQGVRGQVEVVNDNQSQSGRKRNDFAAIINCEASQEGAVKAAMRQFFALPGIRGDARDVGYDDEDAQATGTFEIDLLDPNATRYTSGRNPTDSPAPAAEPEHEEEATAGVNRPSESEFQSAAMAIANSGGDVFDDAFRGLAAIIDGNVQGFGSMSSEAMTRDMAERYINALEQDGGNHENMISALREAVARLPQEAEEEVAEEVEEEEPPTPSPEPTPAQPAPAPAEPPAPTGSASPDQAGEQPQSESETVAQLRETIAALQRDKDQLRAALQTCVDDYETSGIDESTEQWHEEHGGTQSLDAWRQARAALAATAPQPAPAEPPAPTSPVPTAPATPAASTQSSTATSSASPTRPAPATREEFAALNTRPEIANQPVPAEERDSLRAEVARAQENVRDLSQRATDQSLSEDDRTDASKVRNRYSSYGKSLRAILGGAGTTNLDNASRVDIARNAADWVKAVRESQVDVRNADGSFQTDENGSRVKRRNGIDNTAYKRAVDAANFIGSKLGFAIQDFDTGEGGEAPAIAWTGEHPEHRLSFHDVESFRAHRAALQAANGQSAQPQAHASASAAPAAPAPSPAPAATQAAPATPPPASTPAPSPTPAPAPAAEPTPPPAAPTPAPEPQAQQAAPATASPSQAPSAAPAGRRNFASVARQAQQRRGGIQNANMASMLDRIRQRAQNLQNGANNG